MQRIPFSSALLLLTASVLAATVGSQGRFSADQAYWQKMLPNIPMPDALQHAFDPYSSSITLPKFPRFRSYRYAASREEVNDPKFALFFLEKDLHPGFTMKLDLSKAAAAPTSSRGEKFVSRGKLNRLALDETLLETLLPEILREFSLQPESKEAKALRETIRTCQTPAVKGESRYCAKSLESMVRFSLSKLGTKRIRVLTTSVDEDASSGPQEFSITRGLEEMKGAKSVACHPQMFVYPVYYCHQTIATSVHAVPLIGKDGSKGKAVVVCHKDTSQWNPRHLAFQQLKVKPGSVPICHFLPESHIVWAQN